MRWFRDLPDLGDEAIAAANHGLDQFVPDHVAHLVKMRADQVLTRRDVAPDRLCELLLGNQALGVHRQVLEDREWLPPELQLGPIPPQPLLGHVEPKRREREHQGHFSPE